MLQFKLCAMAILITLSEHSGSFALGVRLLQHPHSPNRLLLPIVFCAGIGALLFYRGFPAYRKSRIKIPDCYEQVRWDRLTPGNRC